MKKENKIIYKTREEIELMRAAAQLVSKTLGVLAEHIEPGITPLQLDKIAEDYIKSNGAQPAFLGLYGFPNSLCISVNEAVVHGIPTNTPLKEGDIISVDCGTVLNDFCGDQAYTFAVGEVSPDIKQLIKITKESLYLGIEQCRKGNRIGDISYAVQSHCEKNGYGVVRELVGHGLGKSMHEKPEVPNFGRRGNGPMIYDGLVIAIEPMINLGKRDVKTLRDDWTIVTADGKPSVHFEHDVAVVNGKPDILTTFDYVEEALRKKGAEVF